MHLAGVTANPDASWVSQQARQVMWELAESESTDAFDTFFESEAFHVFHTPYQAPNANAYAERWFRTVREECLDLILVLNTAHLRRMLLEYIDD